MITKKMNIFLILFTFISVITLYSARNILHENLSNLYIKQLILYLVGFIILNKLKINKLIFKKITFLYIISVVSLTCLLIFTKPINNAKCWFSIPFIGTIQPSEFVKIILVIFTSIILTSQSKFKYLKVFFIFLIPAILTYLEPDTGLLIIYIIGTLGTLFAYIKKPKYIIIVLTILLTILGIILYLYFYDQYLLESVLGHSFLIRLSRIINWKNQDGYQLNNALISIGIAGTNVFFNNINNYFPEAHNDFIFATFASSFGYIFTILFIILLLVFDLFLFNIAKDERNETYKIMEIGFISMLIYEQIQNIGMNIGLLPITGITLPFISYGGSSLISFAIILNIIKNSKEKGIRIPF